MIAHEDTPAREPHMKGTTETGTGIHVGVVDCSPDGSRPMMCRRPSYSKKYSEVPNVSLTDDCKPGREIHI